MVAMARIFCSRQDAIREAEVLETFAGGRHEVPHRTRAQVLRERVTNDRCRVVVSQW
jgi:hypothetical protein